MTPEGRKIYKKQWLLDHPEYHKKWWANHSEEMKLYKKQHHLKYPDARLRSNLKRYKLDLEEYQKRVENQNGKCAICRKVPKRERLSVDHNHMTGQVRGLLCSMCNAALGGFGDSVEVVENAVCYLKSNS